MRRIISAITVLALALSLVATATQSNAAVAGYDSAYAGESAFLNLSPGQSGSFTVFFANTGTTSWVKGAASQVDLAACLADKVTCNAQDATEAPFNSGWLSATRYATQSQTTVAPGQIGTFTYNVMVPTGTAAGNYRFNGALVLAATGADIRNEGYYQDVTVGAPSGTAAAITSLTPTSGSVAGGTSVTITGTGIVCTPQTPSVIFDTSQGTVTSCGATQVVATSPAHAAGAVNVTVTNAGAPASNALSYVYADTTRPTYDSVTVAGNVATVTFSEAVCRNAAFAATAPGGGGNDDWTATVNGVDNAVTADSLPTCNATFTNGVTTANVFLTTAAPNGSFVAVTLETQGGNKMRDTAGNLAASPRSNTATAGAPETTRPTVISASGLTGSNVITVTFSEPVYCTGFTFDATDITITDTNPAADPTVTGVGSNACGASPQTADTSFSFTISSNLVANTSYTVTLTPEDTEIRDVVGNSAANPQAGVTFTSGAADTTAPTLTDTRLVTNAGFTTNMDSNDVFTITFSEAMNTTTAGDTINVSDADTTATTTTITCNVNATCTFNADGTILTVTITQTLTYTGGDGFLSYPATITGLGGFSDVQGNAPNLAGSADRIIDVE